MTAHRASSSVALITGTSSGIGLESAIALARAGWTTVATMRDTARSGRLRAAAADAGVELDIRTLDVTDPVAIISVVDQVAADYGRLDALVNNAGSATLGTVELLALDDIRAAMEVNFFGVVAATKAAMPHLRASAGRVVTVSSVGGIVGQPFNEAYCAAKFAVEGFLESLHPVAKAVGVAVVVVEPGAVSTEFVANAGLDETRLRAGAGVYEPAIAAYLERTRRSFDPAAAQRADAVADVIVAALTVPVPAFRLQTSDAARSFVSIKLADLDGSHVTGATAAWITAD